MNTIRAFLAVNLPIKIIEAVREIQDRLRASAREAKMKVAWVPPPNMHVTLKFLGNIPDESVWAIQDTLLARLEGREVIPATVQGTGAFPDASRPRILWVGVHSENQQLEQLAKDIDAWLSELGFASEKRPFHAHLTLGRVKHGATDLLQGLEETVLGDCTIHEVVLYKSVLLRKGAEYTPLSRLPLGTNIKMTT